MDFPVSKKVLFAGEVKSNHQSIMNALTSRVGH